MDYLYEDTKTKHQFILLGDEEDFQTLEARLRYHQTCDFKQTIEEDNVQIAFLIRHLNPIGHICRT